MRETAGEGEAMQENIPRSLQGIAAALSGLRDGHWSFMAESGRAEKFESPAAVAG
jgi:hypothetical protein